MMKGVCTKKKEKDNSNSSNNNLLVHEKSERCSLRAHKLTRIRWTVSSTRNAPRRGDGFIIPILNFEFKMFPSVRFSGGTSAVSVKPTGRYSRGGTKVGKQNNDRRQQGEHVLIH